MNVETRPPEPAARQQKELRASEDRLGAARGLVFGVVIASLFWAILLIAYLCFG